MAGVRGYEQQQQLVAAPTCMTNRPEYYYVYVAESEFSNVGYWILLEPDKTLSLVSLRGYFATCFGIKYKFVNAINEVETRYIRYHNGFFRFPPGLDMNNTRFVAYYYNDKDDVNAFMEMAEANDDGSGTLPVLEFKEQPAAVNLQQQPQQLQTHNDSTFLGRTALNFEMDKVLVHGAQSTPNKPLPGGYVSSTSDVILQEKTIEVISVHDSQSMLNPPPPPPGPPQHQTPKVQPKAEPVAPIVTGVKAKLGPSVSSTSDVVRAEQRFSRTKRDRDNDSSGFQREKSSVMIKPQVAPKSKNMLNRYQQQRRTQPEDVSEKTPLKITLQTRGHQTERNAKILKIEDEKGRTTALLTKRKWGGKPGPSSTAGQANKRRYEPEQEQERHEPERYEKRRRYNTNHQQYYHQPEVKTSPVYDDYYRTLNVLLVGFNTTAPAIQETTTYFSEFGVVQDLHLYTLDNRHNTAEYYAFMTIRTDDAVSLFSDRHLYNGTVIYAIRVDGDRLPSRLNCKVCGYYGINVGYLHYHLEGYPHQTQLQKRLDSLATTVPNIYRDSYYRITHDEVYVQYPNDAIQELVRNNNDYMKRPRTTNAAPGPSNNNRYYSTERERYY
ncbi:hypothetical protein pipiens_009671 [Culex pipiens pipiens]|uniref:RRM domain-containing protein n=1 Tax=Culex pipiens pipiens TaxID=38569 RepID=A0ABD1DD16_CULPP